MRETMNKFAAKMQINQGLTLYNNMSLELQKIREVAKKGEPLGEAEIDSLDGCIALVDSMTKNLKNQAAQLGIKI